MEVSIFPYGPSWFFQWACEFLLGMSFRLLLLHHLLGDWYQLLLA